MSELSRDQPNADDNPPDRTENLRALYQELCTSYHAIDDFRAKLLGFLPLATGAGFLVLFNASEAVKGYLGPIGVFGFVVTLGLFTYELYGIKKCLALIRAGQRMERSLGVDGHFATRREVAGFINVPFASGMVYSAVLAAWAYVAVVFTLPAAKLCAAVLVFAVGLVGSLLYNHRLQRSS